jgi:hypothetical protein
MENQRRPSLSSSLSSFRLLSPRKSPKKPKKRDDDAIFLEWIKSMSTDERQKLAEDYLNGSFLDRKHSRSAAEAKEMNSVHQHRSFSRFTPSLPMDDDLSPCVPKLQRSCPDKESLTDSPKKKKGTLKKETLMSPRRSKELPPTSPRKRPKTPAGHLRRSLSTLFTSFSSLQIEDISPPSAKSTPEEDSSQNLRFGSSASSLQIEDISPALAEFTTEECSSPKETLVSPTSEKETLMSSRSRNELPSTSPRKGPKTPAGRGRRSLSTLSSSTSSLQIEDISPPSAKSTPEEASSSYLQFGSSSSSLQFEALSPALAEFTTEECSSPKKTLVSPTSEKETLMSPQSRKELPPTSPRKRSKKPAFRLYRSLFSSTSSLQIEDIPPVSAEFTTEERSSQKRQGSSRRPGRGLP